MSQDEVLRPPLDSSPEFASPAELAAGDAGDGQMPGAPLNDLVGIAPPEHTWIGNAFVWMMYVGGGASLLWMIYTLATSADLFRWTDLLAMVPMSLFPGAVMIWLGRMIQQFRLPGWGVAMLFLAGTVVSSLFTLGRAMDVRTIGLSMTAAAMAVVWMGYLWTRKDDFS